MRLCLIEFQSSAAGLIFLLIVTLKHYSNRNLKDVKCKHATKQNKQWLSSHALSSGERPKHKTHNKMEKFAFDLIHCCLSCLYVCLLYVYSKPSLDTIE